VRRSFCSYGARVFIDCSVKHCYQVTAQALDALSQALEIQGVMLVRLVLKASWVRSGGQVDEETTANLNMIIQLGEMPLKLTFSYSCAIKNPVLAL
jgi:fructose-bisphosphate aldolase class 1